MTADKISRPRLAPALTIRDRVLETMALAAMLCSLLLLTGYTDLPDKIPQNFDLSGKPGAWGPRAVIFVLPATNVFLYLLLTVLSRSAHLLIQPQSRSPANFDRRCRQARLLIALLKVETLWMIAYLEWRTMDVALGRADGLGPLFLPVLLVVLIVTVGWNCRPAARER